jgi:hypothetical protein
MRVKSAHQLIVLQGSAEAVCSASGCLDLEAYLALGGKRASTFRWEGRGTCDGCKCLLMRVCVRMCVGRVR